ncbi:MAG: hypothetical protein MJY62_06270, partial [Bacteroidales bacterium]|nr:hypothetical protein [Bacteroidales bacterium]
FGYTSILAATTPAEQALHDLSLELNVGENLPPVMIAANKKDPIIPLHQFPDYYNALSAKGFDVELHMYETGSHGWGFMTKEYAEALCRDNSNVWGLKDPPGTPYGDDMGKSREIFNNDFLSFTNRVKK